MPFDFISFPFTDIVRIPFPVGLPSMVELQSNESIQSLPEAIVFVMEPLVFVTLIVEDEPPPPPLPPNPVSSATFVVPA